MNILKNSIGIQNCGNTCFINSALQMLYSINDIREFIINSNSNNIIITSLQKIFNLLDSKKTYIKTEEINNDIKILYNNVFKSIIKNSSKIPQQDAHEFIDYIIDNIFEDSRYLKELFTFEFIDSSYCKRKLTNIIYDHRKLVNNSTILQLSINEHKDITLDELIYFNFTEEVLDKDRGEYLKNDIYNNYGTKIGKKERCENNNKNCKKLNINIPDQNKYLIIQLVRMVEYNFIDNNININKVLNIDNVNYSLVGSILRGPIGNSKKSKKNINMGHYIYVTYNEEGELHKVYNDSNVSKKLPTNFVLNNNSYLLLYVRNEEVQNKSVNEETIITSVNHKNVNKKTEYKNVNKKTENKSANKTNHVNKKDETIITSVNLRENIKKLISNTSKIEQQIFNKVNEVKIELNEIKKFNEEKYKKINKIMDKLKQEEENYKLALSLHNNNFNKLTDKEKEEYNLKLAKNLQQEENNYNLAKKLQENENYKFALSLQNSNNNNNQENKIKLSKNLQKKNKLKQENENYKLALSLHNNNFNKLTDKEKKEYNLKLAKNLQQEENNYNLAKKLQENENYKLALSLQNNNK